MDRNPRTCGRCGTPLRQDELDHCTWCGDDLCWPCAEGIGECGHVESRQEGQAA